MGTKTFKINYCKGQVGSDGNGGTVSDILNNMSGNSCPAYEIGDYTYEIRDLVAFNSGASFKGVLAKFRSEDLPHIGSPGGTERNIDIAPDEGLIEKNYFLYFRELEVLVYQLNKHGSSLNMFEKYLTQYTNITVIFNHVLQQDSMSRLLSSNARPKKIELSFARPGTPWMNSTENGFSNELMKVLTDSGGYRMHLTVTPPRRGILLSPVKETLIRLRELISDDLSVARVDVEEGGVEQVIDLVADRLVSYKRVTMNGQYPMPDEMFNALRGAWDDNYTKIRSILGDD